MNKTATILHDLTPEQITNYFQSLERQISELKNQFQPKIPTEYLTRKELAKLLKCDLSTIHNWCVKGKLKPYGIGNRVYFKRSEIEANLVPLSVNTSGNGGNNG